ncbi:unnamed protein product [Leuciscus chuanchicus]
MYTQIATLFRPGYGPHLALVEYGSGPHAAWNDGPCVAHSCLPDLGQKQAIAMPHVSQEQNLANRSGPHKGRHSTLHVGQIRIPQVPDVGRIRAETMLLSGSHSEKSWMQRLHEPGGGAMVEALVVFGWRPKEG